MVEEIWLSMRAIMMFERMTGKDFTDFTDIEDIDILMYCSFVCSTGLKITLTAFNMMLEDKKFSKELAGKWEKIGKYMDQFRAMEPSTPSEGNADKKSLNLTAAINTLIFDYGLDADYVLNKMDLWEIEVLFKGAEEHYHNQMEDKRLWAYIGLLPNIDKKHSNNFTPRKMMEFPWEKERMKAEAEANLAKEKQRMVSTVGMNIDDLLNGKGRTDTGTGSAGHGEDELDTERSVAHREGSGDTEGTAGGYQGTDKAGKIELQED